jgi:hypothetical protein
MNELSIHKITEITIEREIIPYDASRMNPNAFEVINITAKDKNGVRTRLSCFVEPDFNPLDDMVLATNRVDLGDVPCADVEVSHVE